MARPPGASAAARLATAARVGRPEGRQARVCRPAAAEHAAPASDTVRAHAAEGVAPGVLPLRQGWRRR